MAKSISDVVSSRVRKYRRAKGWTVQDLSDRCRTTSPTLTAASITNLERKPGAVRARRTITLEELFTLAHVLEVHPISLLLPMGEAEVVEIDGTLVTVEDAFLWLTAESSNTLDGRNAQDMSSWYAIAYLREAIQAGRRHNSAAIRIAAGEEPSRVLEDERLRLLHEAEHAHLLHQRFAAGATVEEAVANPRENGSDDG